MAKKGIISIENLKSLCNYYSKENIYISKQGKEYMNSLSNIFNLKNQNDKPFTEELIKEQPTLENFSKKFLGVNDFKKICILYAEPMKLYFNEENKKWKRKNEKIIFKDFINNKSAEIFKKSLGVAYLITCIINKNEHIIKIGQTRTTFEKRLQSYNCGCVYNWRTASTTNIKMLQSMLTTRLNFNLYIYDCSDQEYILEWHGIKSVPFASPKALAVEDIMMKEFMRIFNKKPLANIQAGATTVNS